MAEPTEAEKFYAGEFAENLEWARECGYLLVCVECGCGIHDSSDDHDHWCSKKEKNE